MAKYNTVEYNVAEYNSISFVKALTETVTLSDTINFSASHSLTETITLSDVFSHAWTALRTLTETVTLSDVKALSILLAALIELVNLSDSMSKSTGVFLTETITPFVSNFTDQDSVKMSGEMITAFDSILNSFGMSVLRETITVSDGNQRRNGQYNTFEYNTQEYNFSTVSNLGLLINIFLTKNESILLSDNFTHISSTVRTFIESLTLSDVVLKSQLKQFLEVLFLNDFVRAEISNKALGELVKLGDWLSVTHIDSNFGD